MWGNIAHTLPNPAFAWAFLLVATITETIWFLVLKKSSGLEVWPWNLLGFVMMLIDVPLLAIALKSIPTGSAYAFWTGASAVAITLTGIWFLAEPATFWRLFFIGVVVLGTVGIYLTS